ncbi:MAG: DUF2344 domain-containing protein [Candidatus Omnitrophica bacterium]|nr:DUF2344 domain-containing protein [Candidatus Omnitrophota bacterium]
MFKYAVRFSKKGDMVYISHLDLMNLFQRAIRRADLPFVLTQGFTPHIKISMKNALRLGAESECECFEFKLQKEVDVKETAELLNGQLPEGIRVTGFEKRMEK